MRNILAIGLFGAALNAISHKADRSAEVGNHALLVLGSKAGGFGQKVRGRSDDYQQTDQKGQS